MAQYLKRSSYMAHEGTSLSAWSVFSVLLVGYVVLSDISQLVSWLVRNGLSFDVVVLCLWFVSFGGVGVTILIASLFLIS